MGAGFTVDARLPKELPVSDTELCSILSNGLENAMRAVCALEESDRQVTFYCELKPNRLLIEICNPYAGELVMQDGLPVSGREGHGYGCRSIRSIATQNRGLCTFDAEHGVFTLRVMIPLHGLDHEQQVR